VELDDKIWLVFGFWFLDLGFSCFSISCLACASWLVCMLQFDDSMSLNS